MSVLILKNDEHEGPGSIADYLNVEGIPYRTVEMYKNDGLYNLDFSILVILGGPMSVNDEVNYPYITTEIDLVKRAIGAQKRILGICLGAQIVAKALGASVYKGSTEEIGWLDIEFSRNCMSDDCISEFLTNGQENKEHYKCKMFHWHGETFDLPQGSFHLAESDAYRNQAFRFGNKTYAFQFHIEVTREMIREWFENFREYSRIMDDTNKYIDQYAVRAKNFYKHFFVE